MSYQNSILKGFGPQSEPHEKSTKYMISPGQVRTQDLSRVKRTTSHYTTAVRVSAAKNAGCIRGAYLRRRLVSSKTIPATKKPLVKNFETSHVFQYLRKEIVSGGMGERHYFLRLQKPFSRKVGGCSPPPPPAVPTALPINTDKEFENNFLVFGHVKMLQEHEYTSFILSSEVHNDEAPHFSGWRELYAEYISLQVNKLHFIKYP